MREIINRPTYSFEHEIVIEYDETRYKMEFFPGRDLKSDKIIFRRISDDKIVHIFDGNTKFIYQTYNIPKWAPDAITSFVICTEDDDKNYRFKHYIEKDDALELSFCSKTHHIFLELSKVGYKSFIISKSSDYQFIYNLNRTSNTYIKIYRIDQLYDDKEAATSLGENVLMVTMNKKEGKFEDSLTFGINPDTLKIATPIWSGFQERTIPLYTDEQVMEYAKNNDKYSYSSQDIDKSEYDVRGNVTIEAEIVNYLKNLNNNIKSHSFVEICSNIKREMEQSNIRKREPQKDPKKN